MLFSVLFALLATYDYDLLGLCTYCQGLKGLWPDLGMSNRRQRTALSVVVDGDDHSTVPTLVSVAASLNASLSGTQQPTFL
jgi:hypothetical protein